MIKKLLFILITATCIVQTNNAFIISAATYTKIMPSGHTQYIHILGDLHKEDICAQEQKNEFISVVKKTNAETTLVIIEDGAYYQPTCKSRYLQSSIDMHKLLENKFLLGLSWRCEEENIRFYNPEFREITNQEERTCFGDFFTKHLDPIKEEVKGYHDTELLNAYYEQVLQRIETHEEPDLRPYRDLEYQKNTLQILLGKTRLDCTLELFTARIAHAIHHNQDKEHIFICVGDLHKNYIGLLLVEQNYQESENTLPLSYELIVRAQHRGLQAIHDIYAEYQRKIILPVNINEYFTKTIQKRTADETAAAAADTSPAKRIHKLDA